MTEKIIISGEGGQGVMLLGKILAQLGLEENKNVSWFPSYGAEVRGGTAFCMVTISDEEISSPYVDFADTIIVMNEQSFRRFKDRIEDKGLFIINSSLLKEEIQKKNLEILEIPLTQIASSVGDTKCANMVALGAYLKEKRFFSLKNVMEKLRKVFKDKGALKLNVRAIREGMKLAVSR